MRFISGAKKPTATTAAPTTYREELAPLASAVDGPQTLQELMQESTGGVPNVSQVEVDHHTVRNWGARHENEDRVICSCDELPSDAMKFDIVGVLDGHDSDVASDLVSRLLPREVGRWLKEGYPVIDAYTKAMELLEAQLKQVTASAGTCVLSCLIAGRFIWCSNLGDCRAILIPLSVPNISDDKISSASPAALPKPQMNGIVWMSRDHKASTPYEKERIARAGGQVNNGRVEGLEPSRTLGDFDVKANVNKGVISIVPEVRRYELGNGSEVSQAVLVCCTDGVWDVLSGADICNLIASRKEIVKLQHAMAGAHASEPRGADKSVLRLLAEDFVQFSIAKGSRDDCTAIVSFLSVPPCGVVKGRPARRNESL